MRQGAPPSAPTTLTRPEFIRQIERQKGDDDICSEIVSPKGTRGPGGGADGDWHGQLKGTSRMMVYIVL